MYYYRNIFHYKAYTKIEIKHEIKINISIHSNAYFLCSSMECISTGGRYIPHVYL